MVRELVLMGWQLLRVVLMGLEILGHLLVVRFVFETGGLKLSMVVLGVCLVLMGLKLAFLGLRLVLLDLEVVWCRPYDFW